MRDAQGHRFRLIQAVIKACVLSLTALVGTLIALTSLNYFPAQFESGFLHQREAYFYSWYAVAFYTHVISAPIALFTGLLQSIHWLRNRSLKLHRSLGKIYVFTVLLFAVPSGLAMALKADGTSIAVVGFATLALATGWSTWLGYRHARLHDIPGHRKWMTRSYVLICSAVTLRFLAAVTNEFELPIKYDAMAWLNWLPQLLAYEILSRFVRKSGNANPNSFRP